MQAIKYSWQERKPTLILLDNGLKRLQLLDTTIKIKIGEKHCIGYFRDGKHFLCKSKRTTEEAQCNECKIEDDYSFCIRCGGSECINPKMRESCEKNNYFIYLAAFNSMLKVGISYEFRLIERLVEQGADFGAKIAKVKDGMIVRTIEQKIKKEMNITDKMTGEEKNNMLFCNPNIAISNIKRAIEALKGNGFSKYLIQPEIYDLREYYGLSKVFYAPSEIKIEDNITLEGKIIAAKGNIIILEVGNRFYSFNVHRLIGRELYFQ